MDCREFASELVSFSSTDGEETAVSSWFEARLDDFGFETYEWGVDADLLAGHPSFPEAATEILSEDRNSVGGVLELGDPDAGPTLVLNGHLDVVPVDESAWSAPPFEARWNGDELTARGAADMKAGLTACVFAALELADSDSEADTSGDLDGRVVVEGVVGEEAGGVGAATAALDNPYPFERDAAIIAEPTSLTPVVASEGSLMKRLELTGRASHAATPWRGESVLDHFEAIRDEFADLAAEREARVTHPLYEDYPTTWPVVCGTVEAGDWASTVPASLTAAWRIGVAPSETVAGVEAEFDDRLADLVADSEWLSEHPPEFDRFSVQFEPSEIDPDERVVRAVRSGMVSNGLADAAPRGVTYGADARHYVAAGIPTVMFGPGSIEQAHFPDETVHFGEVETAVDVLADAAAAFLAAPQR